MGRSRRGAVLGLWAVAAVSAAAPQVLPPVPAPERTGAVRSIQVTGEGQASAQPDTAIAGIGVIAVAPTLTQSNRDASARIGRVIAALEAGGVAKRDIRTAQFDVGPERRNDPQGGLAPITGYRVVNQLQVKVRNLDKLGKLLDDAVKAGADDISGVTMTIDDPSAVQAKARSAAVKAAQAQAAQLAAQAGVRLGPVLEISEVGSAPVPVGYVNRANAVAPPGVPIETGELTFTVQVQMAFGIATSGAGELRGS